MISIHFLIRESKKPQNRIAYKNYENIIVLNFEK